jgi:hypothetical protein
MLLFPYLDTLIRPAVHHQCSVHILVNLACLQDDVQERRADIDSEENPRHSALQDSIICQGK